MSNDKLFAALVALNDAAYVALRASKRTCSEETHRTLLRMSVETDRLVDDYVPVIREVQS